MIDIRIQESDFSLDEEYQRIVEGVASESGAIAAFVGRVRKRAADSNVQGLYLEHYPAMTESSIQKIVAKAEQRWTLQCVTVVHRVGNLPAGSQIVLVLVASSHRPDAFAACEFIMDYLKSEAVFWKKEIRDDEDVWIRSTADDRSRRDDWLAQE